MKVGILAVNDEKHRYVPKYPVQTLEKALDIIDYLKDHSSLNGTTLNELSKELGMGKSSVHRLLDTLMAYDYVEKTEDSGGTTYRLGWGLFHSGSSVPKQHGINNINYVPILEELSNKIQESINLGILNINELESVLICKIEYRHMILVNSQVGDREPLYATGIGKIFLSDMSDDMLEKYFRETELKKFSPNTIVDKDELMKKLDEIRNNGYSMDDEELIPGMRCFAMPIRDYTGKIVSAVSVSGPSDRITDEKINNIIRPNLTDTCSRISRFMGYFE